MPYFIGHINSKIDSKGRFLFPAAFKKQLAKFDNDHNFIIKKDIFEPCLVLYPHTVWQKQLDFLTKKLNPYNRQHNMFLRKFLSDVAEVNLDANNRILIPKHILSTVNITDSIVLVGMGEKIEIWNPADFEQSLLSEQEYSQLATKLLNNFNADND